jgi:hypothetical protein
LECVRDGCIRCLIKAIYLRQEDFAKALSTAERLVILDPTSAEIEQRYPNEWVLVEVTEVDKVRGPLFGRVLGHSHYRRDLVEVNRGFGERNPRKMTYVFFTGPVAPEGYTVIV